RSPWCSSLRQTEYAFGDDVALYLRGTAVDGGGQGVLAFEQQIRIGARRGAGSRGAKLPDPLQRRRPQQFENVALRTCSAGEFVVQHPVSGGPQRLGVGEQ